MHDSLGTAPLHDAAVSTELALGGESVCGVCALRALAFAARTANASPYVRVLYGDAGRQGDPWGGLRFEVNGRRYHFGAGLVRYPHLIGNDRVLLPEGNKLLASGELVGVMDFDMTDWRWVQEEVDVTSLLPPHACTELAEVYRDFASGRCDMPHFQSYSWSLQLGYPIVSTCRNCTTIHAQQLNPYLPRPFTGHMPLDFVDLLHELAGESAGWKRTPIDCVLHQLLSLSEAEVFHFLCEMHPEVTDWNGIAKGVITPPDSLIFR